MGGIEIFIGGGILLCNAVLVAYLLKSDRNGKKRDSEEVPPQKASEHEVADNGQTPAEPQSPSTDSHEDKGVAPSKFNVDEFMARMASEIVSDVKKQLPKMLSEMVGELKEKDVEFVPDDEIERFTPAKVMAPLNSDEIDDAFNTDMRDIDDTPPSEPLAQASSIDELEDAVATAVNPDSTDEELAAAGKIIEPYKETRLYDVITSNEEIDSRVELCFRLSIQSEISLKKIPPKKPKTETPKSPKVAKRSLSVDLNNVDPDDFDVADILKNNWQNH